MSPSLLQHLSISNGNIQVDASFMQTLWNVHPICSGSNIEEGIGHKPNLSSATTVYGLFFTFNVNVSAEYKKKRNRCRHLVYLIILNLNYFEAFVFMGGALENFP